MDQAVMARGGARNKETSKKWTVDYRGIWRNSQNELYLNNLEAKFDKKIGKPTNALLEKMVQIKMKTH